MKFCISFKKGLEIRKRKRFMGGKWYKVAKIEAVKSLCSFISVTDSHHWTDVAKNTSNGPFQNKIAQLEISFAYSNERCVQYIQDRPFHSRIHMMCWLKNHPVCGQIYSICGQYIYSLQKHCIKTGIVLKLLVCSPILLLELPCSFVRSFVGSSVRWFVRPLVTKFQPNWPTHNWGEVKRPEGPPTRSRGPEGP